VPNLAFEVLFGAYDSRTGREGLALQHIPGPGDAYKHLVLNYQGACVMTYADLALATVVCQLGWPSLASIAISCESRVPMKSVSPSMARPRLTRPQQGRHVPDDMSKSKKIRPVAASRAITSSVADRVQYSIHYQRRGLELSSDRAW